MRLPFIALALAAASSSHEAARLGRQLAGQGTLATILPLMQSKKTDEPVKEIQTWVWQSRQSDVQWQIAIQKPAVQLILRCSRTP